MLLTKPSFYALIFMLEVFILIPFNIKSIYQWLILGAHFEPIEVYKSCCIGRLLTPRLDWLIQLNLKIICRKCNQPYESGVNLLVELWTVVFLLHIPCSMVWKTFTIHTTQNVPACNCRLYSIDNIFRFALIFTWRFAIVLYQRLYW